MSKKSKITVRWSTNPADFGFQGKPSNWLKEKGQTMGIERAANFAYELNQKIGQGTCFAIRYWNRKREVTKSEIDQIRNF